MKKRLNILVLITVLFLSIKFTAVAQINTFSHYAVKDGLSQSVANCFLQDSEGYLWIGTQNGLNRFTAYGFDKFIHDPSDSNSISDNWIFSIVEDRKGNLWIGTQKGLNKFDKKTGIFSVIKHHTENSLIHNYSVYGLFCDTSGNILINTPPELHILNPETNVIEHYSSPLSVDATLIDQSMPILQDSEGLVWIASVNGLANFDIHTKKFVIFVAGNNNTTISNNYITSLFEDHKGQIWIGTQNGLNKYDKNTKEFTHYFNEANKINSISSNYILSIIEDKSGNLWVGTASNGMNKISFSSNDQVKSVQRFLSQSGNVNAISGNSIYSLFIDNSNNLWIGAIAGIDIIDLKRKKFRLYRRTADINSIQLSDNAIFPIFEYEKDILWLGTWGSGLNVYNRKTGEIIYYSEKLTGRKHISNDFVHSILDDQEGRIWVGTRNGLNIYDKREELFKDINEYFPEAEFPDFHNVRINTMIKDKNGNIYIGTQSGLHYINMQTLTAKSYVAGGDPDSSLGANLVYSILEDTEGDIWIATTNGLDRFLPDQQIFKHFRNEPNNSNSLCDNFVISLCQDSEGFIWVGTNSALNRLNKETLEFEYFYSENDFPSNIVYAIIEDNNKTLWFTTGAGLCKYSRETNKFITYNEEDGLQGLEFNLEACYKAKDGEIFVGGINGFNSFYPDSLFSNTFVPPVSITSFVKENNSGKHKVNVSNKEEIVLTHRDYAVTIEFAALDYTNPKENLYAYKMEGLSDKRIEIGKSRIIQFLNLPRGSYVLTVYGTNNEGLWNEQGTSIKIKVLPPWWKSKLAYFSYVISIIFLILLLIKLREKQLVHEKKVLEQKVKERTAEINLQKNKIEQANDELKSTLETVNEQNKKITQQRDDIEKQKIELEKLSIVASEISNGVIITDRNGKIQWINRGFTKMFGYNLDEFIEATGNNIINTSDEIDIDYQFKKCIQQKQSVTYLSLNKSKNRKKVWVQTNLTPIVNEKGEIINLIAVESDITEIKEAEIRIKEQNTEIQAQSEELMVTNERLIELSRFKDEMSGMIVHDLKNPLNVIIGLAQNETVKQSGKQMLNMIMNILDVSKFENTKIQLKTSNNSIYEVSKSALQQVDLLYQQKNIELINRIQNYYVDIDQEIIERVMINLLTNAIKYTPNNGTITLESEEYSPDFIRIKVKDTGEGIPPEKIHKVFGKFEQVIARDSGLTRSTGIGLTFCKLFVEAHGGEIGVDSEVENLPAGKAGGTTFWFTLPIGMQGNEEITITEEVIEEKPFELTPTERELLKPFLLKLQELEVYESTEVEKVIEQIDCSKTQNLQKWKAEMENAMEALNEEKYKKLIHLID
ncbi:two-component regulator propeller domain-containing protein [Bacteroidota bacterium]